MNIRSVEFNFATFPPLFPVAESTKLARETGSDVGKEVTLKRLPFIGTREKETRDTDR